MCRQVSILSKLIFYLLLGGFPFANSSEYASAIMDTAFKVMMSEKVVAQSVINSILQDINSELPPIIELDFADPDVPLKERGKATMDFHAVADGGRHVIIEMQAKAADHFDKRALFYAASTFANQSFPRGKSGDDDRPSGQHWSSLIKDVYAIQFVDYDSRNPRGGFKKYFRMYDAFSDEIIDGIHMIQIALKRIDIPFPVPEEIAREFNETQWWYYLFKFSHRFTDEEIRRCRGLGMPDVVISGTEKLKQKSWAKEVQDKYRNEVEGVDTNYKALAAERSEGRAEGRAEGRSEGEKAGQLRGLVTAFLKNEQLDEEDIEDVSERFSRDFVRNIWDMHRNRRKTEDLYMSFIVTLNTHGLLIE
jgi:hypothetical protein